MKKLIFLFPLLLIISCTRDKENSITLGVEQTIQIPVNYVSVSANIQVRDADASTAEETGYEKLSQAVNMLTDIGYEKDQLEINSGEIRNQNYRDENPYQYNASIKFDIPELDKIDSIRRALLQQGVNSFDITAYKNSKEDSLYDAAYLQAIEKAKKRAQRLLTNQQLKVGKILNLSEHVEQTVEFISTKQVEQPLELVVTAFDTEPLFNKNYYNKTIEFSIEFALE